MVFVFTLLALVVIIAIAFFYVSLIISKPPKGRAIEFLQSPPSKKNRIIACIGDSLTHGNIGDCWVESLRDEYPEDTFLNEGINGEGGWQAVSYKHFRAHEDPEQLGCRLSPGKKKTKIEV